jgi:hypothetical protein
MRCRLDSGLCEVLERAWLGVAEELRFIVPGLVNLRAPHSPC